MVENRPEYGTGEPVHLGDSVSISSGQLGTVVFVIETSEYRDDFPRTEWEYLRTGFMVEFEDGLLVHYESGENELRIDARGTQHEKKDM